MPVKLCTLNILHHFMPSATMYVYILSNYNVHLKALSHTSASLIKLLTKR